MAKKGENIYKRKDGRWEARFIKGYTAEGKIKYGYCYGKTYREAKCSVTEAKAALVHAAYAPVSSGHPCFGEYCLEWLQLNRDKIKESTYVKYLSTLEKHILPKLGGCSLRTLSSARLQQFSHALLHTEGLSPKTVRDVLTILHGILKYVGRQNPWMPHIEVVYPKDPKKEMRVLSVDEQVRFTRFLLQDMDESKFGTLLALMTGMRIGEICALRWQDVDLQEKVIHVRATMQRIRNLQAQGDAKTKIIVTEPKSNTSVREIPLTEDAAALCKRWQRGNPAAFLLTGSADRFVEPRSLQYRMNQYTKACGLSQVHFHTLRHTFATRCVEVDFEIKSLSEILGHSSPTVTLERYVHSSMALKRSNMNKLKSFIR